jgi:hypothetical protein
MPVEDSTLYPDKEYIIFKIGGILKYSSDNDLFIEIQNHEGKSITIEELADQYYPNPEDYFEQTNKFINNSGETGGPDGHNEQTPKDINQQYVVSRGGPQSITKKGRNKKIFYKDHRPR